VAVTVRIEDVERDGDAWRAEATLGAAGDLPIVGLAGSGIPGDRIEEGRSARIVGLVKRAHPSASDQRFAVVPRSLKDLRLGRVVGSEQALEDDVTGGHSGSDPAPGGPGRGDGVVSTSIDSIAEVGDAIVLVGGRLTMIHGRSLTLDDGTGRVVVHLSEGVGIDPPLRVGEILNVSGRVRVRGTDDPELVVHAADDVLRASTLTLGERDEGERTGLLAGTLEASGNDGSADSPPGLADADEAAVSAGPPLGLLLLGAAIVLAGLALLAGAVAAARPDLIARLTGRPRAAVRDLGVGA
jgi:hypothetical protein